MVKLTTPMGWPVPGTTGKHRWTNDGRPPHDVTLSGCRTTSGKIGDPLAPNAKIGLSTATIHLRKALNQSIMTLVTID